jgi:hypothetical protein
VGVRRGRAPVRQSTCDDRATCWRGGDFAGALRGDAHNYSYSYANAWIICGAQKLGRFDISRRGMEFLLLLQHAEDGGFRMQRDNEEAPQDLLCTSQAGNACLITGHLADAKNAARFLRTVWEAQPHPERELFLLYKPGQGLRTEFPEERQRLHSIRIDRQRQMYFNIGIASAFLARLTMATGDREWAELGKRYLEIGFNVLDEMYETAQAGKVGWGAALTYGVTGERRYLELAERVGGALLDQQTPEGAWDNTGGYTTDAVRTEVTCEFIVLLDECSAGSRARRATAARATTGNQQQTARAGRRALVRRCATTKQQTAKQRARAARTSAVPQLAPSRRAGMRGHGRPHRGHHRLNSRRGSRQRRR